MSDAVTTETRDGITTIALNRPDNRNSMTADLLEAFANATDKVRRCPDTRAVVITGRGNCFSAGADFRSAVQAGDERMLGHERSYRIYEPFLSVLDIEVPVIGALQGHAVGGGFGLSLMCDIRIVHKGSKYGANFSKLGISPGMAISYLLPRLIGASRANELLFTGRLVLGDEAERIGLASYAFETPEEVLDSALSMARHIADNAPLAVRLTKQAIREGLGWDTKSSAMREAFAQAETLKTEDAKEGMAALLEKRSPTFHGR